MFTRFIRHVAFSYSVCDFIYKKKTRHLRSLLVLVAPLASALTLNTPTNVSSGAVVTITWTAAADDPYVNQTLILFPFLRLS